jgi:C_GCAxxG_C_C family probable redox protein
MDYQTAVKVSAGFGGGMFLGSVCGAVTGGIMAIGLKHGGVGTQPNLQTGMLVRNFTDRFKALHKAVNCPELTGFDSGKIDLSKPEAIAAAYKAAQTSKAFAGCPVIVKDATQIALEIVNAAPEKG